MVVGHQGLPDVSGHAAGLARWDPYRALNGLATLLS